MQSFTNKGSHLIIGKSGSGKTVLISNVVCYLTEKKIIQGVLLFSTTAKFNNDYPYIDKRLIFRGLDMNLLSYIVADREVKINNGENPPNLLIILDDVVGQQVLRSRDFDALISKARHLNLYIIISIQFPNVVTPLIRDNCNSVSITKIDNVQRLNDYHDLAGFGTKKEFLNYMQKSLALYEWHIADRKCASKKLSDCFKRLKPEINIPKFKWTP